MGTDAPSWIHQRGWKRRETGNHDRDDPITRMGYRRNENGNLTCTYDNGITFTVFPDKRGRGFLYRGGGKFSPGRYATEEDAVLAANGSATGGGRSHARTPGGLSNNQVRRLAGAMRNNPTLGEAELRDLLRASELKWRPRRRILGKIVDFYCDEARLVVELDGKYHQGGGQARYDRIRDAHLALYGVTTLRIPEADMGDPQGVFARVNELAKAERLKEHLHPSPPIRYIRPSWPVASTGARKPTKEVGDPPPGGGR